ncbi:hypothetical protein [Ramlibacter rhizophilus]|uniref:Toxin CptA n=1 Tax=Ramlibacter rhizophilus TaxID=1781167 RepID=A0A4Z0BBJ5_9BURK|nr:hypothetical protein [Ramlibacter rhizophilus]TFY96506.1 hypothetical protein EZ242_21015 [Ramlibacter rhizophilus]
MRSAPSVTYPVGRSLWCAGVLAGVWLLALANLVLWMLLGPAPGARQALVALVLLACVPLSLHAWRTQLRGELDWDGAAWHLRTGGDPVPIRLDRVWDAQRWMVLRWRGPEGQSGSTRWVWLAQGLDTEVWQAFRRAVYFSAGAQAQSASARAPATPT